MITWINSWLKSDLAMNVSLPSFFSLPSCCLNPPIVATTNDFIRKEWKCRVFHSVVRAAFSSKRDFQSTRPVFQFVNIFLVVKSLIRKQLGAFRCHRNRKGFTGKSAQEIELIKPSIAYPVNENRVLLRMIVVALAWFTTFREISGKGRDCTNWNATTKFT